MSTEAKIVRRPDMRGGAPTIDGTRITVTEIVRAYRMYLPQLAAAYEEPPPHPESGFRIGMGTIATEIAFHFGGLTEAHVRAALAYWYEHQEEIEDELDDDTIAAIEAKRKYARPR